MITTNHKQTGTSVHYSDDVRRGCSCALLLLAAMTGSLTLPCLAQKPNAKQEQNVKQEPPYVQSTLAPASSSAALSTALLSFARDKADDDSAQKFNAIIEHWPKSDEAAAALYYLGLYYHRKYYILKQNKVNEANAKPSLDQARSADHAFISKYGRSANPYLADVIFDKSLVYLKLGMHTHANDNLKFLVKRVAGENRDNQITIHQVIYGTETLDVTVKADELATKTLQLMQSSIGKQKNQAGFDYIIKELIAWCKLKKPNVAQ